MAETEVSFFFGRTQPVSHTPFPSLRRPLLNTNCQKIDDLSALGYPKRREMTFSRNYPTPIHPNLSFHSVEGHQHG